MTSSEAATSLFYTPGAQLQPFSFPTLNDTLQHTVTVGVIGQRYGGPARSDAMGSASAPDVRTIYYPKTPRIADAVRTHLQERLTSGGAIEAMAMCVAAAVAVDRSVGSDTDQLSPVVEQLQTAICNVPAAGYPDRYEALFDAALAVLHAGANALSRDADPVVTLRQCLVAIYDDIGVVEMCYATYVDARTDWTYDERAERYAAPDGSEFLFEESGNCWWVVDAAGNQLSGPYHDPELAGVCPALVQRVIASALPVM